MATPSIQTLITQAQQVLNLQSSNEIRATLAAVLANANVGTPLNPNLTTQQLWNEFGEIVRQSTDDIMSIITDQMMRMVFSPPAPGGAGADKQVIFNDGGVLAGDAGLMYNKATDALTITGDLTVDTNVLKVDTTNDRVGMGTATPGSPLDVRFATNPAINNAVPINALRVFTSVAQAVDVGGQIGLGGLYNATDVQAFGNISGKKENSTSGNNAGYLVFGTCDSGGTTAERARFNSTGAFVLAGGTTGANGVGVAFPATQSASSDANCLDDYVESTFSPTIVGSTTAGTATYSTQIGRATKVGRLVTFSLRVAYTVGLGTGNLRVGNLPFTAGVGSVFTIYAENIALTAGNIAAASMSAGNTYISIDQLPTGGGAAAGVPYDVAGDIQISGSYIV